ncbi:hypothetical protein DCAR_0624499 [Daucus carota subsp. sativus]|uniref:Uncharacterized protein n=1 Tax=Daucus carota subsp. sativus TaxID=79200 RepID=A0AAF0XDN1_DAUCS|nr:hypothetical protein DCAR_0624499 [Daucus carota subsp. sativus]
MAQISTYFQPMSFRLLFISRVSCPAFPHLHFDTMLCDQFSQNIGRRVCHWNHRLNCLLFSAVCCMVCILSGKISKWNIIGGSVVLGLVSIFPRISYSLEGFQSLLDNHPSFSGNSKFKEDKLSFLAFVKKFMLALFAIASVLTNMDHPVKLAAKLTVVLLSSKPSPSSVYFIIDQCRQQYMQQNPLRYKIKPLYAKQVKVQDYKLLFVAKIELHDQKFTLIGILGNWWVIQMAPCLEALSVLRNKA